MTQPQAQYFSWDGVAFQVPADWDMSAHELARGVTRLAMEDTSGVRLEMEWIRPPQRVQATGVRQRYLKLAKALTETAAEVTDIQALPEDWSAFRYDMGEGRLLTLATFSAPVAGGPVCFIKLHDRLEQTNDPEGVCRQIADTFSHVETGFGDWHFYDVHLRLDRQFRLVGTALHAGRKFLQFQWSLRRLFVWVFSLADLVTRDHDIASWCAAYLKGFKGIRGRRFEVDDDGTIRALRLWYHPLGHSEEIGRMCWRYRVDFRHVPERNQIVLWVYHYRSTGDIRVLEAGFDPVPDDQQRRADGKQRE